MRISKKGGRLRVKRHESRFNPMDGMANLADVMLVFACGLIVALIFHWNVDVNSGNNASVDVPTEKYEVEGMDENNLQSIEAGAGMEEMGKVYRDPKTGKYFVVEGGNE